MERAPPLNLVACLFSPHQSLGTDVQTLLYQRDQVTPLPTQPPIPDPTPHPPSGTGLLSRRWGGEMAVRARGDT